MPQDEWSVVLEDEALTQLNKLDKSIRERIKKKLEAMRRLSPARTLKKHRDVWVQDTGGYRIMYLVDATSRKKRLSS